MMKRREYVKPTCSVVYMNCDLMETLPVGGSRDRTDSGDDSGGGLSKKDFFVTDENEDQSSKTWEND